MQTNTARGMQTMEQALADLVLRGVVTREVALTRSAKAEQLDALLARAGMAAAPAVDATPIGGLRAAGSLDRGFLGDEARRGENKSMWKKEISFRRKPKPAPVADARQTVEASPPAERPPRLPAPRRARRRPRRSAARGGESRGQAR